jgi:hypothetical protein
MKCVTSFNWGPGAVGEAILKMTKFGSETGLTRSVRSEYISPYL